MIFALNSFGIISFNIFFDGWWTLFLIIPAAIGLITEKEKMGNIICLAIGVILLLASWNFIDFEIIGKLIVPTIIVGIGAKLIYNSVRGKRTSEIIDEMKEQGDGPREGYAAFSGCDMNFAGDIFRGCEINATFGGAKCDLRDAIIEGDAAIKAAAIFGGIDILVPQGVNIKVNSTSLFGGVSNKSTSVISQNAPTIYISALCMFGGVEIK